MPDPDKVLTVRQLTMWLTASLMIVLHTITLTWWAATLSAGQESLKELFLKDITQVKTVLQDHENRLREQERRTPPVR